MPQALISKIPPTLASDMVATGVWQQASPVSIDRLALVNFAYIDFAGQEHDDGEMIVLDAAADRTASLFAGLHQIGFPIAKARSVHHYNADDELSMADNNSSCYCYRPIEGTTLTSIHSYGLAIDINPLQNPFVSFDEDAGTATIHPPEGWEYLNRANQKPGMVEAVRELAAENGFFVWGGSWTTPIDYHHFQVQRGIAELLVLLGAEDGKRFLEAAILEKDRLKKLTAMPSGDALAPLVAMYKRSRSDFFAGWTEFIQS